MKFDINATLLRSGRQSYFVAPVACAGLDAAAGVDAATPSAGIVPDGPPK
jgi:hypothetical protein